MPFSEMQKTGPGKPVPARATLLFRIQGNQLGDRQSTLGDDNLLAALYLLEKATQSCLQISHACRLHMYMMVR